MDATPPALESALLRWLNSFELTQPVTAWSELADGQTLWQVLTDIDPEFFNGGLPEADAKSTDNWIPKWQNTKHIDRAITAYLRDECDKEVFSKTLTPDLKAIAIDGSKPETIKLVKGALLAAMYSPKSNQRMVGIMSELGASVAGPIADMIGDMQAAAQKFDEAHAEQETRLDEDVSTDSEPSHDLVSRDPELEREEQLIRASQHQKRIEAQLAQITKDLEEKNRHIYRLEEELAESKLEIGRRVRRASDDDETVQLKLQTHRDRDYIAQLESDLAETKNIQESQQRALERLRADETTKQELRDELQLTKSERDEFSQKAKANENLKKKIQSLQEQQKADQALREELSAAQEQLQELEHLREHVLALKKANEENMETIANGEQEIFDQKTAKKRLEHELKVITQRFEQSRDMATRYQEANMELESKLREVEDSNAGAEALGSLEEQLGKEETDDASKANRKSMMSLIGGEGADLILLQQKVDLLQARCTRVEEKYLDVYQENLGLQAAIQDEKAKQEDPFVYQANKLHAAEAEIKDLTNKVHAISTKNMELQHSLAEISGTNQTEGASGADHKALKDNYEALLTTHEELQKHADKIDSELDDQKALLRHRLLDPNALRHEDAEAMRSNEFKVLMEQLQVFREASDEEAAQMKAVIAAEVSKKLETGNAEIAAREKQIEDRDAIISKLKKDAERLKKEAGDKASIDAHKELQALQRENRLITGAWYDIASRLQSNTVVLQRKAEVSRSWIGRQRAEVGRAGGPVRQHFDLPIAL
ncbi:uncharacterized protein K452DRAFT_242294 [Aplosporella prunicola CBS 121167]|uniref:HOOK N-terminal domain-containing protein n=1 Tax=Aplosporella prunicola CBS 121167 TaxID=1176127 RepID=A0A6A6BP78_9PEZI|nr:uncharacterized protein K452DRAFT_242294 [Aplosporella prunicola CBS 121167]KAF2145892.1 hypothetical protein K452DRAFT_242294 [Aplosporella prunicola CBS 121167]